MQLGGNISIFSLLNQIKNKEIVLPAIQRGFVWKEEKIEKLLDSIMRGYPIGLVLFWETYENIKYRLFEERYRVGDRFSFKDNSRKKKLRIVLDGQQRLQSLYIALYGIYDDKELYFDILSGGDTDDFREDKYIFYFATPDEIKEWNQETYKKVKAENDEGELEYYLRVKDLFEMSASEKRKLRKELSAKLDLSEQDETILEDNVGTLGDKFTKDDNILKVSIIDEDKPINSQERQKEADILEAFVRVNREGTPLSRSDLIFSMLKLNWQKSAEALPDFVYEINKGNSFDLDTDFVVRCLFAVSELGTKFDIDILRKSSNIEMIRINFDKCCKAIESTVDFVQSYCWCSSSKVLGGYYNLIPLVYYLFHAKNHQIPNNQIENARKSLYLFGFVKPFSRYADSRIWKFIKEELKDPTDETFPLKGCIEWIRYWENIEGVGEDLLRENPLLVHHLVQSFSGAKTQFKKNEPQIDHIFPRSILRKKEFDEAEINHFANFWILGKHKNQNKTNQHPQKYFEDISDSALAGIFIDRKLFNYRRYRTFIRERAKDIIHYVSKKLKFKEKDFVLEEK